jgi:hypothetical protein
MAKKKISDEPTVVNLKVGDENLPYPLHQAQRILDYQKQNNLSGFSLSDENFEIVDGTIKRKDTRTPESSEKLGTNTKGEVPRE